MDPHPPKLKIKCQRCVRMRASLRTEAGVPVEPAALAKDPSDPKGQG